MCDDDENDYDKRKCIQTVRLSQLADNIIQYNIIKIGTIS